MVSYQSVTPSPSLQHIPWRNMKAFQSFRLDEVNQCLWHGKTRVSVMPKPFAVLQYLVNHPGRLITHDELLSAIWPDTFVQPEVLRRYILEIRRLLGDEAEHPRFIETLPKRGYQFIALVTDESSASTSLNFPFGQSKLVGRQPALADLHGYLKKAFAGERQVVFVSGETGIGKTSLLDAFQRDAESIPDVRVTRGQAVEGFGGKEAYYPVLEALGHLIRTSEGTDIVRTLTREAPTWIVQLPSLIAREQHAALEQEILGATRERMVRELCAALEVITQESTLLLILEDLHWVDHSTVDLISAIARRREPARLLMLGSFRPADLILFDSPIKTLKQDLLLHHLCSEVVLERLDESDVADYLTAEFSEGDLPLDLASIIHKHSEGNPLFMIAMLDHLAQQGVLSRTNGQWNMTLPLDQIDPGVPDTLRQMLEMQLQHLSQADQQLLKCASVVGDNFNAWSIATMMVTGPAAVEAQCDKLADRLQFLRAAGFRELGDGTLTSEYQFRHGLYRDILYRQLGVTQRVEYHRRLAEGLAAVRTTAEAEAAAEIALHFEEGRVYEAAIQYLMLSAENATKRYAHRESIVALEHALELLPKIDKDKRQQLDVQIIERLGDAQYALGEMERSAATYHLMATRAAEAGLLSVQANALMHLAHSAEAIPFFLRAIELDPNFAGAYVNLSRIYSNLGEVERAREYAKKAYDRRDNVSERDRLSIEYQYQFEVIGDQARAAETLQTWKEAFPLEFQPPNSLSFMHNVLGDFDQAVAEAQEAVRRNPAHGFPYSNLSHAYRGLGQFDQARKTAEQAVARSVETLPTRRLLYQLAIISGDKEAAARHLEWGRDRPREFELVAARGQVAAYSGKVSEARELFEKTARMAEVRNIADVGTNHLAWATWMELAFGNRQFAVEGARRVLGRSPSYDPKLRIALTLALTGFPEQAEAIVDDVVNANPEHTIINKILAPLVRTGVALARREPAEAVKHLQVVLPYDLGFCAVLAPIYLRAHAYLALGLGLQAACEFQRLLDHRGSEPFSPFCAVASLGRARGQAMAGERAGSLKSYEQFLQDWSEADSDVPVLLEARNEYERFKFRSNYLTNS